MKTSELKYRGKNDDDDQIMGKQEAEEDETLYEIKVTMKDQGPFTGISDYLTIVDMPGIEDGIKSFFIKNYVDENQPRLVPAILVNLTQGAFTEL